VTVSELIEKLNELRQDAFNAELPVYLVVKKGDLCLEAEVEGVNTGLFEAYLEGEIPVRRCKRQAPAVEVPRELHRPQL